MKNRSVKTVLAGILNECFRYRLSGIAMVFCLTLSMLAAYYGVTVYKNIYMEEKDRVEYEYKYTTHFSCPVLYASELPKLPKGVRCNLKLLDCSVYSEDTKVTSLVNIIINSYEENIPLVRGHYADETELSGGERLMVAGRNKAEKAYKQDGEDYLNLFGEEYRVIGVAGAKDSVIYDYYQGVYFDGIGEELLKRVVSDWEVMMFHFVLESNVEDTDAVFENYIREQYNGVKEHYSTLASASAQPSYGETSYCVIIYLFCFVCISIVVSFWLEQRRHELKLCRVFGFSGGRIILRLARSFGAIMLVSALVSAAGWAAVGMIIKGLIKEYHLGFSWRIIFPYLGILVLSTAAVSVIPVSRCLKRSLAENQR